MTCSSARSAQRHGQAEEARPAFVERLELPGRTVAHALRQARKGPGQGPGQGGEKARREHDDLRAFVRQLRPRRLLPPVASPSRRCSQGPASDPTDDRPRADRQRPKAIAAKAVAKYRGAEVNKCARTTGVAPRDALGTQARSARAAPVPSDEARCRAQLWRVRARPPELGHRRPGRGDEDLTRSSRSSGSPRRSPRRAAPRIDVGRGRGDGYGRGRRRLSGARRYPAATAAL